MESKHHIATTTCSCAHQISRSGSSFLKELHRRRSGTVCQSKTASTESTGLFSYLCFVCFMAIAFRLPTPLLVYQWSNS